MLVATLELLEKPVNALTGRQADAIVQLLQEVRGQHAKVEAREM